MDQGWKRRRYSESASKHLQLWSAFSGQLRTMRLSASMFLSEIRLKMYLHSRICTYIIYCASVLIDSSCKLKTCIESSMVGIVQWDWWVRGAGGGWGLCGCTWQSGREMWYTRSKLQQRLNVGKTFSPCLFCGGTSGRPNCSFFIE